MCFINTTYYYPGQKYFDLHLEQESQDIWQINQFFKTGIGKFVDGYYYIPYKMKRKEKFEEFDIPEDQDQSKYEKKLQEKYEKITDFFLDTEKEGNIEEFAGIKLSEIIENKEGLVFVKCCRNADIDFIRQSKLSQSSNKTLSPQGIQSMYIYENFISILNNTIDECNIKLKDIKSGKICGLDMLVRKLLKKSEVKQLKNLQMPEYDNIFLNSTLSPRRIFWLPIKESLNRFIYSYIDYKDEYEYEYNNSNNIAKETLRNKYLEKLLEDIKKVDNKFDIVNLIMNIFEILNKYDYHEVLKNIWITIINNKTFLEEILNDTKYWKKGVVITDEEKENRIQFLLKYQSNILKNIILNINSYDLFDTILADVIWGKYKKERLKFIKTDLDNFDSPIGLLLIKQIDYCKSSKSNKSNNSNNSNSDCKKYEKYIKKFLDLELTYYNENNKIYGIPLLLQVMKYDYLLVKEFLDDKYWKIGDVITDKEKKKRLEYIKYKSSNKSSYLIYYLKKEYNNLKQSQYNENTDDILNIVKEILDDKYWKMGDTMKRVEMQNRLEYIKNKNTKKESIMSLSIKHSQKKIITEILDDKYWKMGDTMTQEEMQNRLKYIPKIPYFNTPNTPNTPIGGYILKKTKKTKTKKNKLRKQKRISQKKK